MYGRHHFPQKTKTLSTSFVFESQNYHVFCFCTLGKTKKREDWVLAWGVKLCQETFSNLRCKPMHFPLQLHTITKWIAQKEKSSWYLALAFAHGLQTRLNWVACQWGQAWAEQEGCSQECLLDSPSMCGPPCLLLMLVEGLTRGLARAGIAWDQMFVP